MTPAPATEAHMPLLSDHECPHGYLPDDKDPLCNCWATFDLQCRLDALRVGRAPLPMTDGEGIKHAIRLRSGGMTYGQISMVMALYHGLYYGEHRWRKVCRARGVPGVRTTRGGPA